MNSENQDTDATNSVCWKCKHGICVAESEMEPVFQLGGMPPDPSAVDIFEGTPYGEDQSEETVIEHKRIKAVCFWKPLGLEKSPPILVANVKQCNRFEAK